MKVSYELMPLRTSTLAMVEWGMDTRKQLLRAVRTSRQATAKLSSLVREANLSAEKIEQCLEQGALVEEAFHEIKRERGYDNQRVNAIDMVLGGDRADIARLFYLAPALDVEPKKKWLTEAIFRDANQCACAFIELGAMEHLDTAQRNELLHGALARGNPTLVDSLLQAGCDPNGMIETAMERKEPLLHQVRDKQSVALMLAAGARIDGTDTWGRPALHNVLDRLGFHIQDAKRADLTRDMIETAHALLDAGSPIYSIATDQNQRSWNAISDLANARASDASLVDRLAKMDPAAAWETTVNNIQTAHQLLDSGVIENLKLFSKKIRWASFSFYKPEDTQAIESLLERGVPPPTVFQIDDNDHRKWLDIGITTTPEQIEKKLRQAERDEEHEIFANWDGLKEPELVQASNVAAAARALRIKTQPAMGGQKNGGPRL